ncbi:hypothetical protein PoB_002142400 [Plakobranchus ocellatus]|uniref:Uncharacterized protein n=1 Tax=Plakobranchus ocellatus TaxID=259542 RepID=A0AAV3ZHX7_9GAST|nr:hypothetical protein PoB_002142400 [Plakobranchus ocellatus]
MGTIKLGALMNWSTLKRQFSQKKIFVTKFNSDFGYPRKDISFTCDRLLILLGYNTVSAKELAQLNQVRL